MEKRILLENKIRQAQYHYYVLSDPIITDKEFDFLWEKLEKEYPDSELLSSVGADLSTSIPKSQHLMKMGSLNKVNSFEKLKKWISSEGISYPLIAEWKLDGISIELIYEKGELQTAITRGNGFIGDDITHNVRNMGGVPNTLEGSYPDLFSVKGEIIVGLETFDHIFAPKGFKNPRNTASGVAKQKEVSKQAETLSVFSFDVQADGLFTEEEEKIEFLKRLGFLVAPHAFIADENLLKSFLISSEELRKDLDFQVDGLVIKENELKEKELDSTMRPKRQIAYKWEDVGEETVLEGVIWNRAGVTYTPVAVLEPVEIDGSTVSRASLANLSIIQELGVKINDIVYVTKRGAIIPKIEFVVEEAKYRIPITRPTYCELCGSTLVVDSRLYCPSEFCPGKNEARIRAWIRMTDAKGFGDALIETLLHVGVSEISDLYAPDLLDEVLSKTNLKEATIKAFNQLYAKKSLPLEKFIAGFDIEGIGERILKGVVEDQRFNTLDKLLEENKKGSSVYNSINQMGENRAEVLHKALEDLQEEIRLVSTFVSIKQVADQSQSSESKPEGVFKDMNFCITGKLNSLRKDMEETIRELGGNPVGGVTKNTNVLICNDLNSTSSKMKKAKELGTEIWNEEEFFKKASK